MICWSTVLKSCWRSDLLGSFKKRDSGSCSPAESIFCGYVWLGGRTCHFTISQDFGAASPRSHHGHPLPLLRSDPGNLTPGSPGILIRVLVDWASDEGVHWPEGANVCTSLVVNFSHANYQYTSISLILVNMTLPLEDGAFMPKKAHSDNQCYLVGLQMTSWSPAEGTTWKETPAFFKCCRCAVWLHSLFFHCVCENSALSVYYWFQIPAAY